MAIPTCPKCSSTMDDGFILDRTHGARLQSIWVSGQPVKVFLGGLTLKGTTQMPVVTYRCRRCGYLESYANPPATS